MLVQEKMLDVVGNNLANVDTSGFKARVAVNKSFPEVLMDRVERYTIVDEMENFKLGENRFFTHQRGRAPVGSISFANVMSETTMSLAPGVVQNTSNPLDILINGPGFFVVEDGMGNTFYTRQGHFTKSDQGEIVTHEGMTLQGDGGPIQVGDGSSISIGDSGQVIVDNQQVGQIRVVNFETPTYLRHEGKSLLSETEQSGAAEDVETPAIVGGALERSNVQVVLEMVRMIEANRAYEASAKAVTIQDELSGRMFTSVGKPA